MPDPTRDRSWRTTGDTAAALDRLRTHAEIADALAPLGADYAATLDATAELPRADRASARQQRRGAYLRALRQTLATVTMLKEGR